MFHPLLVLVTPQNTPEKEIVDTKGKYYEKARNFFCEMEKARNIKVLV